MNEFGKRILAPLAIPVGAVAFMGVLVFSLSRILLAVEEMASTSIALLVAAEILGVAAVLAAASRVKTAQRLIIFLTGLGLIAGGAASANIGIRPIEKHGGVEVLISAKNIAFDKKELAFPEEQKVRLVFTNNDAGIPHNVSIYNDESGTETFFEGETFSGVASKAYEVEPLKKGAYYFKCDVHPSMNGTVAVGEGAGEAVAEPEPTEPTQTAAPARTSAPAEEPTEEPTEGGESAGATTETIAAKNIAFDKATLTLAAGTDVTVTFDNQENFPHNFAIYTDAEFTSLFQKTEIFSGPKSVDLTFAAPAAGTTHYFKCDVHPNMKGEITYQ